MQHLTKLQRLKKRLLSAFLVATAFTTSNAQTVASTLFTVAKSSLKPFLSALLLAAGAYVGHQYYTNGNDGTIRPANGAPASPGRQSHTPQSVLRPLTPAENNVLKTLDPFLTNDPLACDEALKEAARNRIERLDNATKLELAQTVIELLELTTECPDVEVRNVLRHLINADGYVAKTGKCFQAILIKALLSCKFKPGFSAPELFTAPALPHSNENAFDLPCPQCIARQAKAPEMPAEKMDRLIGCILSVVNAKTNGDPRLVYIPSKREIVQNQLCNDVFTDYIRTGYCSLDPLTTRDGYLPSFNILERGRLRKKIDELIGATPDQSKALAQLNYELIKHSKEPKEQAEILLKYAHYPNELPGTSIEKLYFKHDGTCKLPWIDATIDGLIANQGTPSNPNAEVKPDSQPAPPERIDEVEPEPQPESPSANAYKDGDRYIDMTPDEGGGYSMKPPKQSDELEKPARPPKKKIAPFAENAKKLIELVSRAPNTKVGGWAAGTALKLLNDLEAKCNHPEVAKMIDKTADLILRAIENGENHWSAIKGNLFELKTIYELIQRDGGINGVQIDIKLAFGRFQCDIESLLGEYVECKTWNWTLKSRDELSKLLRQIGNYAKYAKSLGKQYILILDEIIPPHVLLDRKNMMQQLIKKVAEAGGTIRIGSINGTQL